MVGNYTFDYRFSYQMVGNYTVDYRFSYQMVGNYIDNLTNGGQLYFPIIDNLTNSQIRGSDPPPAEGGDRIVCLLLSKLLH